MSKNSIGQFISALRKASGMTQQEVADRLNVSNKAVSRWERDECAPDLSLIPAIAEMFGVTCDELLRGERLTAQMTEAKKSIKVEKQLRALINRTLATAKTMIYISVALALLGLVCMFGISYGFYRPAIGFTVMLMFEGGALVTTIIAVSGAKYTKADNELFEMAEPSLSAGFDDALARASFSSLFSIVAAIALSLPLIAVRSELALGVVTTHSYFSIYFLPIALFLVLIYLKLKRPYSAYMATGKLPALQLSPRDKERCGCNMLQLGATLLAAMIYVLAPYLSSESALTAAMILALLCLLASVVCFAVFAIRSRGADAALLLRGMRDLFFIPSAMLLSKLHSVGYFLPAGSNEWIRQDVFNTEYLYYALLFAEIVLTVFSLLEKALIKEES